MDKKPETNLTCPLHKIHLSNKFLPIHYGLIHEKERLYVHEEWIKKQDYSKMFKKANIDSFPCAYLKPYILGGCLEKSQIYAKIYYCKECQDIYKAWLINHKKDEPIPF